MITMIMISVTMVMIKIIINIQILISLWTRDTSRLCNQKTSFRFYTLICIDINLIDTKIKDNITIMGVKDVMAQG